MNINIGYSESINIYTIISCVLSALRETYPSRKKLGLGEENYSISEIPCFHSQLESWTF